MYFLRVPPPRGERLISRYVRHRTAAAKAAWQRLDSNAAAASAATPRPLGAGPRVLSLLEVALAPVVYALARLRDKDRERPLLAAQPIPVRVCRFMRVRKTTLVAYCVLHAGYEWDGLAV